MRIIFVALVAAAIAGCQHCSCEDNLFMGTMRMSPINETERTPYVHSAPPAAASPAATMPK